MEHVEESELLSCSMRGQGSRKAPCKSQMIAAANTITLGHVPRFWISVFVDDILMACVTIITILLLLLKIFTYGIIWSQMNMMFCRGNNVSWQTSKGK